MAKNTSIYEMIRGRRDIPDVNAIFEPPVENDFDSEAQVYSEEELTEVAKTLSVHEIFIKQCDDTHGIRDGDKEEMSRFCESVMDAKALELTESQESLFVTGTVDMESEEDVCIYSATEAYEETSKLTADSERIFVRDTEKYPVHENDEDTADISEQNQSASALTEYGYAQKVLRAEKLSYLSDLEGTSIARYNSRYWDLLSPQRLKDLTFQYICNGDKHDIGNIDMCCRNIANYIMYEKRREYNSGNSFTPADFRKIANRVVFKNVIVDARTGKKHSFTSNLPYYFGIDANYLDEDIETPFYDKLKNDATGGDVDSMEMIDAMIAYLIIPNRSGKCFFVMANAKDSGKSLLGNMIGNLYEGQHVKNIDPEHLSQRFAFASVEDKLLLSCLEMDTDRLKKSAVANFKRITGEERMRSENKHKDDKTVPVRFKLLLATNGGIYLPLGMEDPAFYRRLIVIPFIQSTPLDSLINDLDKKLWEERDAILSKCIRKLRKYIAKDGGIVFPESKLSREMKASWMGERCVDDEFIRQAFEYTGSNDDRIAISELEEVYHHFCNLRDTQGNGLVISDRRALETKIMTTYREAYKKRSRVKTLRNPKQSENTYAMHRIKWRADFLRNIDFGCD